ncbi:unnamed protein product [Adineta steineri]|uniref:Uncharacterized protein n=1 Tax=Adineta steineri TaxID=433720 RepID=A0A814GYS9_9BILA|nr:unnamed protein product [Adineta steineri]CAF3537520.1 unnamed protein product [Adineta steineri]
MYRAGQPNPPPKMLNKHGLHVRWPRPWIFIIGIILILLTFIIAGMEIGNTITDLYRATAFGACVPNVCFIRFTIFVCCLMIILCAALITYDVFVFVDPTRCFILSCNNAGILTSSGTTFTGWPVTITWPSYFTTDMNLKLIFMSIQLFCSVLYILFVLLYILTYIIYRYIKLQQQQVPYNVNRNVFTSYDTNRVSEKPVNRSVSAYPMNRAVSRNSNYPPQSYSHSMPNNKVTVYKLDGQPDTSSQRHFPQETSAPRPLTRAVSRSSNHVPQSYSHVNPNQKITVYTIEGQLGTTPRRHNPSETHQSGRGTMTPTRSKQKTFIRPRASSVDDGRLCTRCKREPRMVCATHYERQNYFSNLCLGCNDELSHENRKAPPYVPSKYNRHWVP